MTKEKRISKPVNDDAKRIAELESINEKLEQICDWADKDVEKFKAEVNELKRTNRVLRGLLDAVPGIVNRMAEEDSEEV